MISYPIQFPRLRRKPVRPTSNETSVVVDAQVTAVLASFGVDTAVFVFDQPLVLEAGVTVDMFYLSENTGLSVLTGVSGELLDPQHLRITFDGTVADTGEGWTWTINPRPEKIHTASGGSVLDGSGPATF